MNELIDLISSGDNWIEHCQNEFKNTVEKLKSYSTELKNEMKRMELHNAHIREEYLAEKRRITNECVNELSSQRMEEILIENKLRNNIAMYKSQQMISSKFEMAYNKINEDVIHLKSEHESLKLNVEEKVKLKDEVEKLHAIIIQEANDQKKTIENKIISVEAMIKEVGSDIEMLQNEINESSKQLEVFTANMEGVNGSLDESKAKFVELDEQKNELQTKLNQSFKEITDIEKEINSISGGRSIEEIQKGNNDVEVKLKTLQEDNEVIEKNIESLNLERQVTRENIEKFNNAIIEKEIIIKELDSGLDLRKQKLEKLQAQLSQLTERKLAMEQTRTETDQQMDDLMKEDMKLQSLREKNEHLSTQLKIMEKNKKQYETRNDLINDFIRELTEQLTNLKETEITLKGRLADMNNSEDSDREEENKALEEYRDNYIDTAESDLNSLQAELRYLKTSKDKMIEEHEYKIEEMKRVHQQRIIDLKKVYQKEQISYEHLKVQLQADLQTKKNRAERMIHRVAQNENLLKKSVGTVGKVVCKLLDVCRQTVNIYLIACSERDQILANNEFVDISLSSAIQSLEDKLWLPMYELSKLRGIALSDSSNPNTYQNILDSVGELVNEIMIEVGNDKSIEYNCKRLQEIGDSLYQMKNRATGSPNPGETSMTIDDL